MNPRTEASELLSRVRRIETRVWKLCEKAGVSDPPGTQHVLVGRRDDGRPFVMVQGYDVTLAAMRRELSVQRVDPYEQVIEVIVAGTSAGWIKFEQETPQ